MPLALFFQLIGWLTAPVILPSESRLIVKTLSTLPISLALTICSEVIRSGLKSRPEQDFLRRPFSMRGQLELFVSYLLR